VPRPAKALLAKTDPQFLLFVVASMVVKLQSSTVKEPNIL